MEDRALRGRTSSADAALQTAGVAAYGPPAGPGPSPAGASPKRKIPGGSGDRLTRFVRQHAKDKNSPLVGLRSKTSLYRYPAGAGSAPQVRHMVRIAHEAP